MDSVWFSFFGEKKTEGLLDVVRFRVLKVNPGKKKKLLGLDSLGLAGWLHVCNVRTSLSWNSIVMANKHHTLPRGGN